MSRVCSAHMLQDTNMFSWLWICSICQGYVVHMLQDTNMFSWLWICGVCQGYVVHICYMVRICLVGCGSVAYVKGI
jgi:hypothetical protein